MFLKRIEMQGFKSFADRITINFEDSVTGVVGPNGCGKSNISDAIRWVLGEQSIRSLRGEKMTDVIFAGSENRKAQNMAEVTLVFDNTKRYLNSELDEIEVTRRIYNTEQDAEYLINHRNVRLKDVVDLILDSGLGKDSLSMISQGNISAFAEAKPYERRAIFEEAAGVSKYKKKKIESLNKLERTKENLERTFDLLNELERQVSPLKRAARKAEKYRELKAQLEQIEIAVLVYEITSNMQEKEDLEKSVFNLETNIAMHETTVSMHENSIYSAKAQLKEFDHEIDKIQEQILKAQKEISTLETRRVEIDEKRKYAIEVGNSEEKIEHLSALLEEAKFEYEDRLNRYNSLNIEIDLLNKQVQETAYLLADASLDKDAKINYVARLNNRAEVLENLLKDPFSSQAQSGVKAIMDRKDTLYGIMDVVGQALKAQNGYEEAISSALAGSIYHVITKDESSARSAIEFLKKNKSGRATFLPITVLKEHHMQYEHEIIAKNTKGYLGTVNDFVNCDVEYEIVKDCLLGNVLVADTLENANNLSALLKYSYKIVTLDGDIVHKGGSMTGGRVRNETSIITAQSELQNIKSTIESHKAEAELAQREYDKLISKRENLNAEITEKRISLAKTEPLIDVKRSKYEKLKGEFDMLSPKNIDEETSFADTIVAQLSENYRLVDEYNTHLTLKRNERSKLSTDIDRKEQQVRQIRRQLDQVNKDLRSIDSQKAAINVKLENNLKRLASEYQMTYEFAKENYNVQLEGDARDQVNELRHQIASLGNINMNAPEEYSEVNERYEFIKKNCDDLVSSRDKILKAIEEMDQIMKTQFKEMFDKINGELNNTFRSLFGGGKARLVLEDESDILNTGIDIDVQPPGKSVKSIRLFSGGEKTLIAICVLFTILKVRPVPLIVFDEVEAALDQANVERFAKYVKSFEEDSQFIIITHRPGTMAQCDVLYGVTMQNRGVSQMLKVKLVDAIELAEQKEVTNGVS